MGNVYFIQAADRVKIGFAADVPARLAQLQTASAASLQLLAVLPNVSMSVERRLHRFFADQRKRGEWFTFSGRLAVLIRHVRSGARPISDAEIEHYATLDPRPPRSPEQQELGRLCATARKALKTGDWKVLRAEYEALGGLHAEAVAAIERRHLRKAIAKGSVS